MMSAKYLARKPVEGTSGIALGDGVEAAKSIDGRGREWGLFEGHGWARLGVGFIPWMRIGELWG
jgi:hypothetical protein